MICCQGKTFLPQPALICQVVIVQGSLVSDTVWQVWWEMMDVIVLHASGPLSGRQQWDRTKHAEPHEKEHDNNFIAHYTLHTDWDV